MNPRGRMCRYPGCNVADPVPMERGQCQYQLSALANAPPEAEPSNKGRYDINFWKHYCYNLFIETEAG